MIRPTQKHWCVSALATLCCLVTACTQSQQEQTRRQASDALILAQIRARIAAIDAATISLVHVKVLRGAVTLTGQVHSNGERSAIETAAHDVNGVTAVIDQLVINPKAPTSAEISADLALTTRVQAALAAQIGVNSLRVQVSVHHGICVLSGSLRNTALRSIADETAKGVPGVRKVIDEIKIKP